MPVQLCPVRVEGTVLLICSMPGSLSVPVHLVQLVFHARQSCLRVCLLPVRMVGPAVMEMM